MGTTTRYLQRLLFITLYLITSGCYADVVIPNVLGLSLEDATKTLQSQGLTVGSIQNQRTNRPVGTVIVQAPIANKSVKKGYPIRLVIAIPLVKPKTTKVPNLKGMSLSQAKNAISKANLRLGNVKKRKIKMETEEVLYQSPKAGKGIVIKSKVDLTISDPIEIKGPRVKIIVDKTRFKSGESTVIQTSVSNAGSTINLNGNLWMDLAYNSTITSTSILKFTFVATGLNAEIYGIAFDTNDSFSVNSMNHFALIGGEDVLAYPTANVFSDYKSGDGVVNFSINIGEYFTGAFNRIVFILDNDENWSGSVASFSNVEICDNILVCQTPSAVQASEPTNLAFAGLALMFLGALRRRLSK